MEILLHWMNLVATLKQFLLKLVRFLVLMIKNTQDAPRSVYRLVPIQDFSELWTDEQLYKKYDLNEKEIEFIESMVRPMELK